MKLAKMEEHDAVKQFYCDLINSMQDIEFKPAWKMGVYPTEQSLQDSIAEQTLYVAYMGDCLVGAMILNHDCANEYYDANWRVDAKKEEFLVIHLLAVSLSHQRKGIARQMILDAVKICKKNSIKAIRLDILGYNKPAEKLYSSMGFHYIETLKLFYEDTGLTDFHLYELLI
jgi:GNAT superfamily N-acetyltransferase